LPASLVVLPDLSHTGKAKPDWIAYDNCIGIFAAIAVDTRQLPLGSLFRWMTSFEL
jgi:hypothetical protein